MGTNWTILCIVGAFLIVLLVFIIVRNQKDKKEYTKYLNEDYKSANEDDPDYNGGHQY